MSSLRSQYATDPELEKDGVHMEFGPNSKGKMQSIRIARAGGANKAFTKAMETALKPYRRQIQTEVMDRDLLRKIMVEVFSKTCVKSWENIEDDDNEDMEFTTANVVAQFTELPDLFDDAQEFANKVAVYRAVILEEDAGN